MSLFIQWIDISCFDQCLCLCVPSGQELAWHHEGCQHRQTRAGCGGHWQDAGETQEVQRTAGAHPEGTQRVSGEETSVLPSLLLPLQRRAAWDPVRDQRSNKVVLLFLCFCLPVCLYGCLSACLLACLTYWLPACCLHSYPLLSFQNLHLLYRIEKAPNSICLPLNKNLLYLIQSTASSQEVFWGYRDSDLHRRPRHHTYEVLRGRSGSPQGRHLNLQGQRSGGEMAAWAGGGHDWFHPQGGGRGSRGLQQHGAWHLGAGLAWPDCALCHSEVLDFLHPRGYPAWRRAFG